MFEGNRLRSFEAGLTPASNDVLILSHGISAVIEAEHNITNLHSYYIKEILYGEFLKLVCPLHYLNSVSLTVCVVEQGCLSPSSVYFVIISSPLYTVPLCVLAPQTGSMRIQWDK